MIINLLLVGFILIGVNNILFNKNGIKNSIRWIIIGFVIGYRTIEPINGLKLHPIEILAYAACIRIVLFNSKKFYKMPLNIIIIGLLFISYFLLDIMTRYSWIILLEFKNSILLCAIFFIAIHINHDKNNLKSILKYYVISITTISILGVMEYLFPSFMKNIFGYVNIQPNVSNELLFNRVAFLFWGSHLAANLIPPIFPILLYLRSENLKWTLNKVLLTIIIFLNLFAIYLSGNRISWLIITIYFLLVLFTYSGRMLPYMKTYAIAIVIGFVLYIYSQPVEGRYISTFRALIGNIDQKYDSSGATRMQYVKASLESIKIHPMGTGWGSQGWLHSDILQIGASLGIITAMIFVLSQIKLLLNIYRLMKRRPVFIYNGLFLCFSLLIYCLISFLFNGNILKVQTGVPLYIAWAISYTYYTHLSYMEIRNYLSND